MEWALATVLGEISAPSSGNIYTLGATAIVGLVQLYLFSRGTSKSADAIDKANGTNEKIAEISKRLEVSDARCERALGRIDARLARHDGCLEEILDMLRKDT